MYISELRVENFRLFGEGANAAHLALRPGLTALVGENDSGKSAMIDAFRLALGTRDQEFLRVQETDFHQPPAGDRRTEIRIRCKFDGLSVANRGAFAEYLTYEERGEARIPVIYLNWRALVSERTAGRRRYVSVEIRSGVQGDGPHFEPDAKHLLCATYLRPLRDAERELSAGRGSRLSQILEHTEEISEVGEHYDEGAGPPDDLATLSILGIGDLTNALLKRHAGLIRARDRLNSEYLGRLSFTGSALAGEMSVATGDDQARLRQLLEKLELQIQEAGADHLPPNKGLGSNNLLFIACELLLLGSEEDGFPLLLIEEPEAHLHPQRQLRLMRFLQDKANLQGGGGNQIQILVTTHSPNLASAIDLDNIVLLQGGKGYSLAQNHTELAHSDYRFLQRFLDATKANLFFARGLLIVEGDAENILLPTIANLIDRDLTESGVSIVNVGGVGLRRYARIFQRQQVDEAGPINIPVACLADMDVMPDCAPVILGKIEPGAALPQQRRWKVASDFQDDELDQRRRKIQARASGQSVETFVSDHWTFEYDLALSGLGRELWLAIALADADEKISSGRVSAFAVSRGALQEWKDLAAEEISAEERASKIYAKLVNGISKPVTAQYFARILNLNGAKHRRTPADWRAFLPTYLVSAIDYVTTPAAAGANQPPEQLAAMGKVE